MNQVITPFREFIPVMGVKDGFVLSRQGDVTAVFEVTLPRAYAMGRTGYEHAVGAFVAAVDCFKDEPYWTMVHRQDVYRKARYDAGLGESAELPLLERCRRRHFDGREYLTHRQFLCITMSTAARALRGTASSGVFGRRGSLPLPSAGQLSAFSSKLREFASVMEQNGGLSLRRVDGDELQGTEDRFGLLEEYLFGSPCEYSDIRRAPDCVEAGGKVYMGMEVCEADRLPGAVRDSAPVRELCGEDGDIVLSAASAVGLRLDREHIVNQYLLIPPQEGTLGALEKRAGHMVSMGKYSDNVLNAEGIRTFVREVKEHGYSVAYGNLNVVFWGADRKECEVARGEVSAAFKAMGIRAQHVTRDFPVLWYAGLPGAECEMGKDHLMLNTLPCLASQGVFETFDDGMGGGVMCVTDRTRHKPVRIDTHAFAYSKRLISNYNMTLVGPSGRGKSVLMNCFADGCFTQGENVFIIDVGASYELHCDLIREETGGRAGKYYSWDSDRPLRFNPLSSFGSWLNADGTVSSDDSGLGYFLSLLKTIWSPKDGWNSDLDRILEDIVLRFARRCVAQGVRPVFDDFYRYVNGEVASRMKYTARQKGEAKRQEELERHAWMMGSEQITTDRFDVGSFQLNIAPYAAGGRYSYLLNNADTEDLFSSPFICFDLRALTQEGADKTFYSVVVFSMMHAFDERMRTLDGFKNLIVDEAWQAIDNPAMAGYLKGLWKTARKYSASCVVVTQELGDILSSETIGDAIINNSAAKIVLQPEKDEKTLERLKSVMGLSDRQMEMVKSVGLGLDPRYNYREAFFSFGTSFSGVYGIEPCLEELYAYESEFDKKKPTLELAQQCGSLVEAIRRRAAAARGEKVG